MLSCRWVPGTFTGVHEKEAEHRVGSPERLRRCAVVLGVDSSNVEAWLWSQSPGVLETTLTGVPSEEQVPCSRDASSRRVCSRRSIEQTSNALHIHAQIGSAPRTGSPVQRRCSLRAADSSERARGRSESRMSLSRREVDAQARAELQRARASACMHTSQTP